MENISVVIMQKAQLESPSSQLESPSSLQICVSSDRGRKPNYQTPYGQHDRINFILKSEVRHGVRLRAAVVTMLVGAGGRPGHVTERSGSVPVDVKVMKPG